MFIIENFMTEDLKLSGNELLVYAYISSNLNGSNECYKLQKTIAKNCGMNERTVLRVIKSLEEKKIIKITKHLDGQRRLNVMHIQFKYVEMKSDKQFEDVLAAYNTAMGLFEDKCSKNYTAYKFLIKDTAGDLNKFYDAVKCYSDTINDHDYYKVHIYSFETFTRKYRLYLPGGIEYAQYKAFYDNKMCGKRSCNSEYHIGINDSYLSDDCLLDDDELGNVDM